MKIKIRGLAVIAGRIFFVWGALVACKGVWDMVGGEPEANIYSIQKWEFISKQQWLTWSGFEITYGLACIGIAYLLRRYASFLPEHLESAKG